MCVTTACRDLELSRSGSVILTAVVHLFTETFCPLRFGMGFCREPGHGPPSVRLASAYQAARLAAPLAPPRRFLTCIRLRGRTRYREVEENELWTFKSY
jgi:hypothetical protein